MTEETRKRQAEERKKQYYYDREHGMCIRCHVNVADHGTRCAACADRDRQGQKSRYIYYQSVGICPTCRKVKLLPGEKKCAICTRDATQRRHEQRAKNPMIDIKCNEYQRNMRMERAKNMLCTRCGKPLDNPKYVQCTACREKHQIERKRLEFKYKDNAQCTRCGAKISTGKYTICEKCRKKHRETHITIRARYQAYG